MDILLIISLAGAALYALSRSTLLLHLTIGPDVRGISLITQELYAVVYCCRYLELLAIYTGFLPTVAKIAKITIALAIVLLFRFGSYSKSYEAEHDTVPRWILLLPPFALALVYNRVAMFVEVRPSGLFEAACIPKTFCKSKRPGQQTSADT
jgi:ER lumen protein retaining receptor